MHCCCRAAYRISHSFQNAWCWRQWACGQKGISQGMYQDLQFFFLECCSNIEQYRFVSYVIMAGHIVQRELCLFKSLYVHLNVQMSTPLMLLQWCYHSSKYGPWHHVKVRESCTESHSSLFLFVLFLCLPLCGLSQTLHVVQSDIFASDPTRSPFVYLV